VPDLAPDGVTRDVLAAVRALASDAAVMLVGHEPSISAIGALIAGAKDFATLDKAEAARIVDGALRWRFACDAQAPHVVGREPGCDTASEPNRPYWGDAPSN